MSELLRTKSLRTSVTIGMMIGLAPFAGCASPDQQDSSEVPYAVSDNFVASAVAFSSVVTQIPATPNPTSVNYAESAHGFAGFASKAIRNSAMHYPSIRNAPREAPISLTTNDGTGLVLESLDARAVVEGPLAFTELHLQFRNPLPRVLEGRFQVTLPEGASVSRLAMRLEKGWQEAEMVERMAARRAYEDFLHRKQDPMLLEKEAGNQFSARIFPIPAKGVKEVIVSYSHELSEHGYRLPLRGLPMVGNIDVQVLVAEPKGERTHYRPHELHVKGSVPTTDFEIPVESQLQALRSGSHVVARVRPAIDVKPSRLSSLTILFDTSASRAPGYAKQVQRLGNLVQTIAVSQGRALPLRVAAFDQETSPIYDGSAGAFGQQQLATLLARRPLGASDLGTALQWAGRQEGVDRLLIIGDGVVTARETELAALARTLPKSVTRIDMLLVGGIRDQEAAGRLVRGTRSHDGVVLRNSMSNPEIARRLGDATASLELDVAGASWTWPRTAHGLQPGDEMIVYAAFPKGKQAPEHLQILVNGDAVSVHSAVAPGTLLTRSVVQAQIAHLQGTLLDKASPEKKEEIKKRIVGLSTNHRVLSDHTALLVLESDADYRRFGIDRKALVNIMSIDASGMKIRRQPRIFAKMQSAPIIEEDVLEQDVLEQDVLEQIEQDVEEGNSEEGGTGTRMAEAEGIMGRNQSIRARGQYAMRNNNTPPTRARRHAMEAARRAGVLGVLAQPEGSVFRSINGNEDFASDGSGSDVYGELRGTEVSEVQGAWSYDISGVGQGDDRFPPSNRLTTIGHGRARSEPQSVAQKGPPALTGNMAAIDKAVKAGHTEQAVVQALAWRIEESGNVMALIALGEALDAMGKKRLAARAYGSIIDLFPSRSDLRRFASARLISLEGQGDALAVDSLRKAAKQRPDHLSVHRLLAYALIRMNNLPGAFAALVTGLTQNYPDGRFAGGRRILREDLGIVAAAWIAKDPRKKKPVLASLAKLGGKLATQHSLRFILNWETDANDVDFHIYDAKGGHAFYDDPKLPSGGELFADVTTGYGPECFAISGKPDAYPYSLQVHYYSRGPMGYGMGQVEILQHDGKGGLKFDTRPFVVMNDGAYLALGEVSKAL